MKIQMNKVKCVADRSYNKADDMHLMASIKSRLDKGLKPLLQPIALKKLDGDPQFDYSVEDGHRRFTALTNLKLTEIELGQEAILIDGDSEINAYLANQHTNLSLAEEIKKLYYVAWLVKLCCRAILWHRNCFQQFMVDCGCFEAD